eukprot:gnl/TRDRNA2_/TRDRNA2_112568_c0_seq1.p4 gnl/TRDRNA2_/TRDRNA2_112568_c0~~gnl/TRDRNA2_/TRDRNA2_112568_c0_seq1.p4  ORF type:complete len:128 (-),score=16.50 gnl/TRDRNA2_/TRDRNA2_112568_c0_seq1:123-506(-)
MLWGGKVGMGAGWHTDVGCMPVFALCLSGEKEWRIESRDEDRMVWGTTTHRGDVLIFHNGRARHATRVLEPGTWSTHGEVLISDAQAAAWSIDMESLSFFTCDKVFKVEAPDGFGVLQLESPRHEEV